MTKLLNLLNESPSNTDVKSVFGNIVFGDDTKIVKLQNKFGKEPNTKDEEKIKQLLITWLGGGYDGQTSKEIWDHYKLFKVASKKFPTIFNPSTPNGTILYRGLRTISKKLKDKLKKTEKSSWTKIKIGSKTYYQYKTPVKYVPELEIQSWSSNPKVANEFARGGIILITRQNDEFLFNQNLLKIIYGKNESEVIHFSKKYTDDVFITVSEWLYFMITSGVTFEW